MALVPLSPPAKSAVLVLALVVPLFSSLYGLWAFLHISDPLPDLSDLSGRWWGTISRGALLVRSSETTLPARRYGDKGEVAFIFHLTGELPEDYVAVRGLMVAQNLDADVIVTGPTGIWVYEVKNWSGMITCEAGQWRRLKTYHAPGGRLVQTDEVLRPFDKQWVKEADAVKETLRRRLPRYSNLHASVRGGLIFTHERLSFFADGSCKAWVWTPSSCLEALSGSSEIPDFTMRKRLRVIDALFEWSDRIHERQGEPPSAISSSVKLAERLHEDAVSRAVSCLSSAGEASGRATASVGSPHGGQSS